MDISSFSDLIVFIFVGALAQLIDGGTIREREALTVSLSRAHFSLQGNRLMREPTRPTSSEDFSIF